MIISGFIKCSAIDYDGKLVAVIFTKGCNMTCPYCHNKGLLQDEEYSQSTILDFLKKRQGLLDGVVISGGEPTLHQDLPQFIKKIKDLNYKVKLDTNGTNPTMLKELIESRQIDYVAMDIKATKEKYEEIAGVKFQSVLQSINILRKSLTIDYELRTTVYPALNMEEVETLCQLYSGEKYILQQYRKVSTDGLEPYPLASLQSLASKSNTKLRF